MTRRTRSRVEDLKDVETEDSTENGDVENEDGMENGNAEMDGNFRWSGSGVKINRVMHFGKCEVNGFEVEVGGNVEIMLEKTSAVAEVQQLFETFGDDPYRAKIRWYYPYKDLPKKFRHLVDKKNDKELFKPADGLFLGSEEDIDIETIAKPVTVWEVGEDDIPPPNDYFVRWCFPTSSSKVEQKLIPIVGEPEMPNYELEDGEESESTGDEEVTINYTKLQEKNKDSRKDSSETSQLKENDSNLVNKEESGLSGKMKKNAQKWKSFSTDEVLAELWNTDKDKDVPRSGIKLNLKRKLEGSTPNKTNSNSHISSNNDSIKNDLNTEGVSGNVSDSISSSNSNNTKATETVKKDLDIDEKGNNKGDKSADKDSEFSLNINKNASPFKSIPKKKEISATSVFDFDDDIGGSGQSPKINRSKKGVDTDDKVLTKSNKKMKKGSSMSDTKPSSTSNGKGKVSVKTPNSVKVKGKGEATPGISERKTPRTVAKNMLELARTRLHVSAVPETLPCRDDQFSQIFSFVQDRLKEGTGGCMYISGVPGTGKTATVREVVRTLRESIEESVIPDFKYVEINGMKLTDPNQAYSEIYKALEGRKATPDHAADLLGERFRSGNGKQGNVVLLVDELDLLCTRKQNVMYNIFDWPTGKKSRLVVLAVANTMDLPERMMINRVSSRLGLTRMTFQPYTFKELEEIVLSRIRGTDAFEDDALQLVARKVAAVSGDARRCLDICRRAVEISENAAVSKKKEKGFAGMVGMKHVELALKEMFSSPKILALQCLSEMEIMFMKAVISEFRRTGLEEAIFLEIYDQFKSHCALEDGITPPNMSEAFTICSNLGSCRLLLVEAGNKDVHQRVRLNVNVDDAMFAFKSRTS